MAKKSKNIAAFQGERGAFSHAAAGKLLGDSIDVLPCSAFKDVFDAVQQGAATAAVIPIENTLHGSIHENYDYLMEYQLVIGGETRIRISHQLIACPGVRFNSIKRVFSHPVALNQCRNFLTKNKQITPTSFYDTAGSVKMLLESELRDAAAIASETAAAIYGGQILRHNVEDNRQNYTRFFLLTKQDTRPRRAEGVWKTSVVFSIENAPAALFRAMACFALRGLDLTKIESRPLRGKPWEYLFYVDVSGHERDLQVRNALDNLRESATFLRSLGSYQPTL